MSNSDFCDRSLSLVHLCVLHTLQNVILCHIKRVSISIFFFFSLEEFYCCIKRNALQQTTDWKYFYIFFSHFDSLLVAGVLVEIGFKYEFRFDSYRFIWMNEIKYTKPKMLMDSHGFVQPFRISTLHSRKASAYFIHSFSSRRCFVKHQQPQHCMTYIFYSMYWTFQNDQLQFDFWFSFQKLKPKRKKKSDTSR